MNYIDDNRLSWLKYLIEAGIEPPENLYLLKPGSTQADPFTVPQAYPFSFPSGSTQADPFSVPSGSTQAYPFSVPQAYPFSFPSGSTQADPFSGSTQADPFSVPQTKNESFTWYPLESCEIIHLLRHGQALHNVEAEKDRNALLSPHLFDAPLTDHGFQQVENLRERVVSSGLLKRVELVVTSPLLRTMQTAVGVFGNEEKSSNMTISPPILALEVARDCNGLRPPDMRRNVSEYQTIFPTIDFSQMESDEDNLWRPDVRESEEEIFARGLEFMKWL